MTSQEKKDQVKQRNEQLQTLAGFEASRSPGCSTREVELKAVVQRLRGQLQNCVNHLERAKRHWPRGDYDDCIESANRALYETTSV